MPQCKRFSDSEIKFIESNYATMSIGDMSEYLTRTHKAVRAKVERLGLSLHSLDRNKSYEWSDYELGFIKTNYNSMSDATIGSILGLSESIVCRKRLELGLRIHKYDVFLSNEYSYQYINGKRVCLHRRNMENKIGRKLKSSERVHHIDGNKANYEISNLYLCSNKSDHMLVHASLETAALELVKNGTIKFNQESGKYYL